VLRRARPRHRDARRLADPSRAPRRRGGRFGLRPTARPRRRGAPAGRAPAGPSIARVPDGLRTPFARRRRSVARPCRPSSRPAV